MSQVPKAIGFARRRRQPELLGGWMSGGEAAVPEALPNQHVGFVRRRRQPELLGGWMSGGEAAVPEALPNQHVGFVRRRRQPELLGGWMSGGEAAVPEALPNQHGQAVPLSAALLVVTVVVALALAKLGVGVVDHARAQGAADAVALASAVQPDGALHRTAELVADRNAATVVSIERIGSDVLVTVRRGDVAATARARAVTESDAPFP